MKNLMKLFGAAAILALGATLSATAPARGENEAALKHTFAVRTGSVDPEAPGFLTPDGSGGFTGGLLRVDLLTIAGNPVGTLECQDIVIRPNSAMCGYTYTCRDTLTLPGGTLEIVWTGNLAPIPPDGAVSKILCSSTGEIVDGTGKYRGASEETLDNGQLQLVSGGPEGVLRFASIDCVTRITLD